MMIISVCSIILTSMKIEAFDILFISIRVKWRKAEWEPARLLIIQLLSKTASLNHTWAQALFHTLTLLQIQLVCSMDLGQVPVTIISLVTNDLFFVPLSSTYTLQ